MKRIIIFIFLLFCLVGCEKNYTARDAVSDYLDKYINLDDGVIEQLTMQADKYYENEDIKNKYIEVLKRHYSNIEYNILDEKYDGDFAYVNVRVKVFDLYKVQEDALKNVGDFILDNGNYNMYEFNLYKLDMMYLCDSKIEYDIVFKLIREEDEWNVLQLSNEYLEKLHGIYNYMD